MNEPITVTATTSAWLTEWHKPHELMDFLAQGNAQGAVGIMTFYGPPDKEKFANYTRIGEADITVRLLPQDEQVRLAVQSLNDQLDKVRAAYMQKQAEILAEISKLQAITYEAA